MIRANAVVLSTAAVHCHPPRSSRVSNGLISVSSAGSRANITPSPRTQLHGSAQRSWWPVAMGLSTGLTLISCACSGSRSEPSPPVVMPRRLGTCGQTGTAAPKSSRDRANPNDSLDFLPPRRVVGRQAQPCRAPTGVSTRINVDQLTIACVALSAER